MRDTDKPDEKFIGDLAAHYQELWGGAHGEWREIDSFLEGTYQVWTDERHASRPPMRSSRPRAIVENAVNTQLAYSPKVHRYPSGKGEGQKALADAVEPWLTAVLEVGNLKEAAPPLKQVARHVVSYGYGVLEGPYRAASPPTAPVRSEAESEEEWELREEQHEADLKNYFPFRFRAPPPTQVLMDPRHKQPQYAVKRVKQYASELADLTLRKRRQRRQVDLYDEGNKPFAEVDTVEFFSAHWHALMVAGTALVPSGRLLFVERNPTGFLPFVHGFSGWGQEMAADDRRDPKYMARGILHPVLESLRRYSQLLSAQMTIAMNKAYAPLGIKPGDRVAEIVEKMAAGAVLEGLSPDDIWWLQFPDVNKDIFALLERLDRDIEEATFSMMQAGFRQAGVETVGATAILMNKSNMKFQGPAQQLEHMASALASNILRLARFMDPIPEVRGYGISQGHIGNNFAVDVEFKLIDPVIALQNRELAMREVAQRLISPEDYYEQAGYEDKAGLEERLLMWRIKQMPPIEMKLMIATLRQMKEHDLADAMEQGLGMAAPGQGDGSASLPSDQARGPEEAGNPATAVRQMRKPLTEQVVNPARVPPSARP